MNIAENILRHSLCNVYFLIGSPCAGKTTMCKLLAEKYGMTFYNTNHMDPEFDSWAQIQSREYQPVSSMQTTDWDHFFNRPTDEYLAWLDAVSAEHLEYALIELIKLSQHGKVVTDITIPIELMQKLADPDRIACMLTDPELVVRDYYNRDDHSDIYQCILSLKDPVQSLENNKQVLRKFCAQTTEAALGSGLFCHMRDSNSNIEDTLQQLESHFKLH